MLTPEKKIERKLKEIVLAIKINKFIRNDINKKYANLSSKELDRKVKEKILELYSNYIFLGNNSYGIETASLTYFDTSASDLSILEAAILAGIPQAPSRHDPYNNRA
jgi:penicillin-binding protein 1A